MESSLNSNPDHNEADKKHTIDSLVNIRDGVYGGKWMPFLRDIERKLEEKSGKPGDSNARDIDYLKNDLLLITVWHAKYLDDLSKPTFDSRIRKHLAGDLKDVNNCVVLLTRLAQRFLENNDENDEKNVDIYECKKGIRGDMNAVIEKLFTSFEDDEEYQLICNNLYERSYPLFLKDLENRRDGKKAVYKIVGDVDEHILRIKKIMKDRGIESDF